MSDVFVELACQGDAAQGAADRDRDEACLVLHRARWRESWIGYDGRRVLAHFEAPDAESVRAALRALGRDALAVWTADVDTVRPGVLADLVVSHRFGEPPSDCEFLDVEKRVCALAGSSVVKRIRARDGTRAVWLCRSRSGAGRVVPWSWIELWTGRLRRSVCARTRAHGAAARTAPPH
jgi:hypothetical protein